MYSDLSKKQIDIMNFIKEQVSKHGYPPSVREICAAVNLKSTSTVHSHLSKLEEKGYIKKDPSKPRAIGVVPGELDSIIEKNVVGVPVIGKVTAGEPILAIENIEDYVTLPQSFINGNDNFILKVKGSSMIEAGIMDGDYIIVKKQSAAQNGEIVVALLDDNTATVKRFYKEADRIRLQPENASMEPIYAQNVAIVGIVKGLFRKYFK
ncbi:LexA repressor [Peptoclostridium acidaminophilum DSM 3953]|uniref:LexA repressor n=1 Tax=Peptoclostridium acidaminophilum DSM 3953 TaxID=1286171 RepID=W8TK60_PEPAC|nr:transcriptional repressor LexA [Peptoclostridium acidaminophilum]AHM56587.1 LexA repressor [Peptoclostridium acidaminophilum DSM 3953]